MMNNKSVFYFADGKNSALIRDLSKKYNVPTVCEDARCPNRGICWKNLSATFLLLGPYCTRSCRFCYVKKGKPVQVDYQSIYSFALSLSKLNLKYYTFTMVTRDDLEDQGAEYLNQLFYNLKQLNKSCYIEVLISDFSFDSLKKLMKNDVVDVLAHNIETVRSLTPFIRDRRFSYQKSLEVLYNAKSIHSRVVTKSSIIVGFGERKEELIEAFSDLRSVSCDALTIGQYYRPSLRNIEVHRYYSDDEFEELKRIAYDMGFYFVRAGKNVRTSFEAYQLIDLVKERKGDNL